VTITKADIANKIAALGITEDLAKKAAQTIIDSIIESLKRSEEVKISRFGTFIIRQRRERKGRNPKTGENLIVPAKKVPAFRASELFKEAVK
jgi:DNA-binding protein HU-beta